jgi:hypothetical protein
MVRIVRCLALAFFFLTGFSLFAQNFREARIFVQPVDGSGAAGDYVFFYKQLTYEVVLQYYSLVRTRRLSDFVLRGSIAPYTGEEQFLKDDPLGGYREEDTDFANTGPVPQRPIPRIRNTYGRREFFSWETNGGVYFFDTSDQDNYSGEPKDEPVHVENDEAAEDSGVQEYVFTLELANSMTGDVISKQYLIYRSTDAAVGELVSVMVYNMLINIPDIEADVDIRDNWLYAEVNALWTPRIYSGQGQSIYLVNFGVGLSAEYHFFDFMSVSLGLQIVPEWVYDHRDLLLEAPASLRFVFKPLEYVLEPYGGVSLNLSLMGTTKPSLFSWFAGVQFGLKAGPGMITVDPRFSMDFTRSSVSEGGYNRYMIQLSIGYKFGFFPKRAGLRDY